MHKRDSSGRLHSQEPNMLSFDVVVMGAFAELRRKWSKSGHSQSSRNTKTKCTRCGTELTRAQRAPKPTSTTTGDSGKNGMGGCYEQQCRPLLKPQNRQPPLLLIEYDG